MTYVSEMDRVSRRRVAMLKLHWAPLLALLAFGFSACQVLPTSGPSTKEMESGVQGSISIIRVDDSVTRQLLESHAPKLFSDSLGGLSNGSELVSPGDVLEISLWEAPPAVLFSTSVPAAAHSNSVPSTTVPPEIASSVITLPQQMISVDGTIYVPFAGRVQVAGRTPADIAAEISRQLLGRANQPQVLVRVVANNTMYATVVGDVTNSMRVPLTPRGEHLLDALAMAGGTKDPVEKITLQVTRGTGVFSLPLDTVIRDPRQNIPLQPGDVVTALFQPLSFTALGATGKSDEINFEARGISLAQALARAGGLIDTRANAEGVFIFRFESRASLRLPDNTPTTPDGRVPIVYQVDLTDPRSFFIAQNFPMDNKDILYISNATGAQLQKFLNLVVSTVYPIQGIITLSK